jgi:hypothetical protein
MNRVVVHKNSYLKCVNRKVHEQKVHERRENQRNELECRIYATLWGYGVMTRIPFSNLKINMQRDKKHLLVVNIITKIITKTEEIKIF